MANLLSNASKFSPAGAPIEVRARSSQGRVRVSVRDFGKGIPPEFQPRLFQKFSQADSSDSRRLAGTGPRARDQPRDRRAPRGQHRLRDRPRRHHVLFRSARCQQRRGRNPCPQSVEGLMKLPSTHQVPFRSSDFVAMVLVALGAVVIGGWMFGTPMTVAVGSERVGMTFNSAISFILAGLALSFGMKPVRLTLAILLAIPSVAHAAGARVRRGLVHRSICSARRGCCSSPRTRAAWRRKWRRRSR